MNSYPQFADARRTGTVRRPRWHYRQVTIREHHRLPERKLGSSRPATIVAAAVFAVFGALLFAANAWYDHITFRYESDTLNPLLGWRTAAQLAFLVAGALLTVSVVLCAQAALRSTSTIAIRPAALAVTVFAIAAALLRYRYRHRPSAIWRHDVARRCIGAAPRVHGRRQSRAFT